MCENYTAIRLLGVYTYTCLKLWKPNKILTRSSSILCSNRTNTEVPRATKFLNLRWFLQFYCDKPTIIYISINNFWKTNEISHLIWFFAGSAVHSASVAFAPRARPLRKAPLHSTPNADSPAPRLPTRALYFNNKQKYVTRSNILNCNKLLKISPNFVKYFAKKKSLKSSGSRSPARTGSRQLRPPEDGSCEIYIASTYLRIGAYWTRCTKFSRQNKSVRFFAKKNVTTRPTFRHSIIVKWSLTSMIP